MYKSITQNLTWVGIQDADLRIFDIIMETEFGTSYNSYLLKNKDADEYILFETAKETFVDIYIEKLKSVTELNKIKYLVVNHTEPDHAGSIAKIIELIEDITIIAAPIAITFLKEHTNMSFNSIQAKEGTPLTVCGYTLNFKSVPFLHWPDTIYTYVEEDKLLVTCDSFGAHYSHEDILYSSLTDTEIKDFDTAYQYYYNMIMGPFKPYMLTALDKIAGLEINYVCPGHGLVFDNNNFEKYRNLYKEWSTVVPRAKQSVVVAYVSSYGYTKKIAENIAEGAKRTGLDVFMFDIATCNFGDLMSEVNQCSGLLVGSPTFIADTLPPVWNLLTSLNPFVHKGMLAGAFGSYGWSGEATKNISTRFSQIYLKQPLEPLSIRLNPSREQCENAIAFGENFAEHCIAEREKNN
ncbi:MAG: flavoprotein [Epulopiscium sp. Nele67-Bin004]|nr:MAG: flavoprotein [Epulopiscium sp. Nele67-Bin004]